MYEGLKFRRNMEDYLLRICRSKRLYIYGSLFQIQPVFVIQKLQSGSKLNWNLTRYYAYRIFIES